MSSQESMDKLLEHFLGSAGVSIDSRTILADEIFFAIKGENFDGHAYVNDVLQKGAKLAVIDDSQYVVEGKTHLVPSVLRSLQDLAHAYRLKLDVPVLAITGSNGKTTTKELIHAALSTHYNVHTTAGNLNNHLGVPLTILSATEQTEILVAEMGANHIGEIADLCKIADPDCGLITNIGHAHIEGFGSYGGVIQAKTELYRYLAERKRLIFHNDKDDVLVEHLPKDSSVLSYPSDQVSFYTEGMRVGFRLNKYPNKYLTRLTGEYNYSNILAALTVGEYFQVDTKMSCRAISSYSPRMNRSEIVELVGGYTLILDAYNANPSSMRAALDSLAGLQTDKKKAIILGDMKELGPEEENLHKEILDHSSAQESLEIIVIGELFHKVGSSMEGVHSYENFEAFTDDIDKVKPLLQEKITLIKASRSSKLERIKDLLA